MLNEVLVFFTLYTCGSLIQAKCLAPGLAKYDVTFQGRWTAQYFPKMYPLVRPPAQWSQLIGRSHSTEYKLWSRGKLVSKAVRLFVENGDPSRLGEETQGQDGIFDTFRTPNIPKGAGMANSRLFVDSRYSKVSMIVKIIPSPDWFVGVDSLDLCRDDKWVDEYSVNLYPMDAGTDQGLTFTSPDWSNVPPLPVSEITSSSPGHRASPFYYPNVKRLPHIGRLVFSRIWTYGIHKSKQYSNIVLGDVARNIIADEAIADETPINQSTPLDCLVSTWGAWSGCSKTCGFGIKERHRTITQRNKNDGMICPSLKDSQMCGSLLKCAWKKPRNRTFRWSFGR